jgi:hypothetical protein
MAEVTASAAARGVWVEILALFLGLGALVFLLGAAWYAGALLLARASPDPDPLEVAGISMNDLSDGLVGVAAFAVPAVSLGAAAWLAQRLLLED